jgi:protein-tyrosine phosphatase
MGQSRSVSVIMYYLMRKHKMNFREALDHIRSIKSDVKVNEGFERILREFDNSINGTSRVANTSNPTVQRNCSIRLS